MKGKRRSILKNGNKEKEEPKKGSQRPWKGAK